MSAGIHAAGHDHHHHHHGPDRATIFRPENITLSSGGGAGTVLMGLGAALAAGGLLAAYVGLGGVWARQGLAAFHVGAMAVLAMSLGCTFFVMIFHLVNAGWTGTIRRQFENVASLLPVAFVLAALVPTIDWFVGKGLLFTWMSAAASDDYLLHKKAPYFFLLGKPGGGEVPFPLFFFARMALYGVAWTIISRRLVALSKEQDRTGDWKPSAKARRMSAWAMLVMALTTAFAAFDWLMGVDFRFFSTMWGVYYFAGGMYGGVALSIFILATLVQKGKLQGAVTKEHFHDLGKFLFAFTVFWAYISFSQYFLIWYSNIPEETAFFTHRKDNGWQYLGIALMLGHFALPFVLLISRHAKKNIGFIRLMALFSILIHVADIYWILRPMVYINPEDRPPLGSVAIVDALCIGGVMALFAGLLIRQVVSGPLVAVNDPRMDEALGHRNYV